MKPSARQLLSTALLLLPVVPVAALAEQTVQAPAQEAARQRAPRSAQPSAQQAKKPVRNPATTDPQSLTRVLGQTASGSYFLPGLLGLTAVTAVTLLSLGLRQRQMLRAVSAQVDDLRILLRAMAPVASGNREEARSDPGSSNPPQPGGRGDGPQGADDTRPTGNHPSTAAVAKEAGLAPAGGSSGSGLAPGDPDRGPSGAEPAPSSPDLSPGEDDMVVRLPQRHQQVGALLVRLHREAPRLAEGFFDRAVRERFLRDFGAPINARLDRLRICSEEGDSQVEHRWLDLDLVPTLDALARFYSEAIEEERHGREAGKCLARELRRWLYEEWSAACRREGWFAIDAIDPYKTEFDPLVHLAVAGRDAAGAEDMILALKSIGRRDPRTGAVVRKAQVVVGR